MKNPVNAFRAFKALLPITALSMILVAPMANANGAKEGCKPLGSWMGYTTEGSAWWVSTISGQNASEGVAILDVPGFDPTLPVDDVPTFPTVTDITLLRGVWERTGGNTFSYTMTAIALDDDGNAVYISKLTGRETLSEDCNTMYLEDNYLQIFLPAADPFSDDPIIGPIFYPNHHAYRMMVDLP